MPSANEVPDIVRLLILALGPIGAGKVVQALVNGLIELAPDPLSSDQKFYLAILVSFVVPIAAYGLLVWLGASSFDLATLLWEIMVGYMVSQQFHRTDEKQKRRQATQPEPVMLTAPGDNSTPAVTQDPGWRKTTSELTPPPTMPAPRTAPLDPSDKQEE